MRLQKFRIFHYKSIIDSGDCTLGPDFTILIGKNESGKTAILEALRDFSPDVQDIPEQAIPLNVFDQKPVIDLTFEVEPEELDAILSESHVKLDDFARTLILKQGITISKFFKGEYRLKGEHFDDMFNDASEPQTDDYSQIYTKKRRLDELFQGFTIPELKVEREVEAMQSSLKTLRIFVRSRLNFIEDESKREEIVELLQSMTRMINPPAENAPRVSHRDKLTTAFIRKLPRFIFFSDQLDILPFEISVEELNSSQTVRDFARIANLDLNSVIKTDDLQRRMNLLSRASVSISGDFLGHWKQNKVEITARPEGNKLIFGIKELDTVDFYKVEQRSKGFQWFLSFYLRLNRYAGDNAILLIDEPGMNLHPVAQKDVIKTLAEKSQQGMQIIMSTHSPVLIDSEHLERVRCVIKEAPHGSVIEEDLNSVDSDSLMPVVLALAAKQPVKLPNLNARSRVVHVETLEEAADNEEVEEIEVQEQVEEIEEIDEIEKIQPAKEEFKSEIPVAENEENQEVEEKSEFEYPSSEPEKMDEPQKRSIFGIFRKK